VLVEFRLRKGLVLRLKVGRKGGRRALLGGRKIKGEKERMRWT